MALRRFSSPRLRGCLPMRLRGWTTARAGGTWVRRMVRSVPAFHVLSVAVTVCCALSHCACVPYLSHPDPLSVCSPSSTGWNSVVQFTPGTNTTIAVATNVETNEQAGPSDAYCVAYNRVRQLVERELARRVDATSAAASKPIEDCEYVASGYFGTCVCPGTFYHCEMSHDGSGGKRCVISYFANQTYADCAVGCK
jgi:hypothetical protein